MIAPDFLYTDSEGFRDGDFPAFVSTITDYYHRDQGPPPGPYPLLADFHAAQLVPEDDVTSPVPGHDDFVLDVSQPEDVGPEIVETTVDSVHDNLEPIISDIQTIPTDAVTSTPVISDYPVHDGVFSPIDLDWYGQPFALPDPEPMWMDSPITPYDFPPSVSGDIDAGPSRPPGVARPMEDDPGQQPVVGTSQLQPLSPREIPVLTDREEIPREGIPVVAPADREQGPVQDIGNDEIMRDNRGLVFEWSTDEDEYSSVDSNSDMGDGSVDTH